MTTVHAPELDAGIGWLNTDRPLRIAHELRGQVVVVDFWTYCCINCMHILPDLAFLEHKYAHQPVTFIGVHSAKFTNEADRETIRQAILRYEIKHPVVVDDSMKLWRAYAVRSWPTVVVIDPRGYVVASVAGEGNREALNQAIAQALEQGRAVGTLATGPLALRRESLEESPSGLAFPGKVLADAETGLLFVADSNHNRIVVAELPGSDGRARMIKTIGSGEIGRTDGPAETASFHHPQGLAAAHGSLYVADTENHLIRAIDLSSFDVTTIVGTGEMVYDRSGGLMGTQQGINSPWDLCIEGSTLYCAMAGEHQIWRIDLPVGFARAFAGTGRENLADGPTETSAFAQPSGICLMGGNLYVADSEVSAIRGIDMATERVFTVIGQGLFAFGDIDGVYPKARLQHPLGVAAWGTSLLLADTYNHKIKLVDPKARSVRTLYGRSHEATEPRSHEGDDPHRDGDLQSRERIEQSRDRDEQSRDRYEQSRDRKGADPGPETQKNRFLTGAAPIMGAGLTSGAAPTFFEPGGLSVLENKARGGPLLFVADTNNHRIVCINLMTHSWHEVEFEGLRNLKATKPGGEEATKPRSHEATKGVEVGSAVRTGRSFAPRVPRSEEVRTADPTSPLAKGGTRGVSSNNDESTVIQADPISIVPGKDVELILDIQLPEGAHLNPDAPWHVEVSCDGTTLLQQTGKSRSLPLRVTVPAARVVQNKPWRISTGLTYCTHSNGGACIPADVTWSAVVKPSSGSQPANLRGIVST